MTTTDPGTPPETPPADPPKTFTQEELDRIVTDRLARAKSAAPADYDELKAKAAKLAEIEAANQTELERAQAAMQQATARAEAAEAKAKSALTRAAVVSTAQRLGAIDPDAVLALLPQNAVTVGDDGQVTGAEDAVKALLDSKQYLVGKTPKPAPGSADGGNQGGTGTVQQWTRADLEGKTPEEINAARKAGQMVALMSGGS